MKIVSVILFVFIAAIAMWQISLFLQSKKLMPSFGKSAKIDTTGLDPAPVIAYHIKIECYSGTSYCVKFTNDNWQTSEKLMDTFDISELMDKNEVIYQEYVGTKYKCLAAAKSLKTYKEATRQNAIVYRDYVRLLNYRKAHPVIPKPEVKKAEECCEEIAVY